ncbi:Methionine import ATP-binding protein MetN [Desulforamulus hydrothermalis Lam5 = DSM 18033]|uniref:Methionine import ATP-binding protein MetN n=1 Tax=Desulforamulus hydrothermalis Lam5 = DSM 18033 TaxID=1121428 RepID=K8E8V1_9FIRM|nr:Methionine import ATP-binding protein MetN [Desulforamulus hydrothermalis Lam5 = DSM 18033]SHG85831.1 D-methionine transport system ATP-binding protein [Desulforamulus hydrothermalis Lam5 = DSM 18033]
MASSGLSEEALIFQGRLMPVIQIQDLTKIYRSAAGAVTALDHVNLRVRKGEIYGIIGYSGAGKSTLIRCVNMLEQPTSGSIKVNGQEITSLNETQLRVARRKIGMIFQHFNLLSSRTVFENVAFPLEISGVPKAQIKEKVTKLLGLVGLSDKAGAYPSQLSGGQKQRVGIARALANDPIVLLCDEATSALDPATTDSILALLKDINRRLDLTILMITHEMKVISEICDSVAVLEQGKVIEEGLVIDVFTQPQHPTTRRFVQTIIQTDIPEHIKKPLLQRGRGQIIRVSFIGDAAAEPVISTLVKKFAVDINILYGNINQIQDTPFGMLIIECLGSQDNCRLALQHLRRQGLRIEVLKNVE